MNYSMSRSNFLQRMLKKSDDELDGDKVNFGDTTIKSGYSPPKYTPHWMKNRDISSPCKNNLTSTVKSPSRPVTLNFGEYRNDYRRRNIPEIMSPKATTDGEEVPNIERIRREFEMGFMSPTKQEAQEISSRSGRFVKRIVAAFEEKYKNLNETTVEMKKYSQRASVSSSDSSFDDDKTMAEMMEESMTMINNDACVIESLESRLSRYLDSYVAASSSSSVPEEETRSDDEMSLDFEKRAFAMNERLSTPMKNSSSYRDTSRLSPEKSFTKGTNVKSMQMSASKKLVRSDSSLRRERKPKIVGAYLKKPIEVEDTSVDWIPIPGKNLPRKRSFKRLLSILTGKKSSDKSPKLYCSELNLQEETTKELLQDSGYDEKSGSSSSLVSLASINDVLLQQKNQESIAFDDDYRIPNMTTFKRQPVARFDDDIGKERACRDDDSYSVNDGASDTWSMSSKKLFLEEVSRSELRLSLGPAFPSAIGAKVICSLDRRDAGKTASKNVKNHWPIFDDFESSMSSLPKNPFVSSDNDVIDDQTEPRVIPDSNEDKTHLGFNEFDNCQSPNGFRAWTFPTEEIEYDVPRRYLSKSEPGLVSIGRERSFDNSPNENVYDVPKVKLPRRPRSSIYEDALSLKRRNEIFSSSPPALPNEFYGFSCRDEPHYATIKPRNVGIMRSKELLRTVGDLNSNDVNHTDYYYYRRYDIEDITV